MNGTRLRAARRQARLTQIELGQRAGLSQSMIGALERGERTASQETERSIAAALGLVPEQLRDRPPRQTSAEALRTDPGTTPGLRAMASDRVLAASLDIQPEEWHALRSIDLPGTASAEGYLALLITIRMICRETVASRALIDSNVDHTGP